MHFPYLCISLRVLRMSAHVKAFESIPEHSSAFQSLSTHFSSHHDHDRFGFDFLVGVPRVKVWFRYQTPEEAASIIVFSDTDFAGCRETRKSTSGGVMMLGSHLVKSWSSTQSVIALSSGESEYYGLVSGISQGLGEKAMLADWDISVDVQLWMDATAGIAIGSRRGLGRVKHIDTVFLWVQEVVRQGRVRIGKKDTKEMLADMLTKGPEIEKFLNGMKFWYETGKHGLSFQI